MNSHELWLREHGLGSWADQPEPNFLKADCAFDDNEETCERCTHKQKCDEYFQPLADALEMHQKARSN